MKQTRRTAALSRLTAPTHGELYDLEVIPIRCLPPWVRWLYFELVLMSDFNTGLVTVYRARLLSLLDFDQPERGRRLAEVTSQQLRDALETLRSMGFIRFDGDKNKGHKVLEIWMPARHHFRSSEAKLTRERTRPRTPVKASNGAGSGQVVHRNRPEKGPGGSKDNLSSVGSSLVDNFGPPPKHVSEKMQAIRKSLVARRGGDK